MKSPITITTSIILVISICSSEAAFEDRTVLGGEVGEDVVRTVAEKIRSWCIFPDFKYLLRSIPNIQIYTNPDRKATKKLDPTLYKGLWMIEKWQFDYVKQHVSGDLLDKVQGKLSIKWQNITWKTMEIPIYGGTFAALVLYLRSEKATYVPILELQVRDFFKKFYWQQSVPAFDLDSPVGDRIEGKLDLSLMVEGTNRVTNFNEAILILTSSAFVFMFRASNSKSFDFSTTIFQFSTTIRKEITLDSQMNPRENDDKIRAIKSVNTGIDGNVKLALNGILDSFKGRRSVEEGVARVALLVTRGFKQANQAEIMRTREELRKNYINLLVFALANTTKEEYEQLSTLEGPQCPQFFQVEDINGYDGDHGLGQYLNLRIEENTFFWIPKNKAVIISSMTSQNGLKCRVEVGKEGVTLKLKLEKVDGAPNFPAETKASMYISPDQVSASPAYYAHQFTAFIDKEALAWAPHNEFATKSGGINCLVNLPSGVEGLKLTITSTPGHSKKEDPNKKQPTEDPCANNPCSGNQLCTAQGGRHICQCKLGFTGANCDELLTSCDQITCLNGGKCEKKNGKVVCNCLPKFRGNDCSITGGAGQLAPPLLLSIILIFLVTILV